MTDFRTFASHAKSEALPGVHVPRAYLSSPVDSRGLTECSVSRAVEPEEY